MATGAVGAAQPHMQRHHGALAEADQRERRGRKVAARELGIEERFEHRRGLVDAEPALVGIAEGEREPLPADRRLAARLRRMRRHEGGLRQQRLPGAADLDEVVAVGAIAVQEHHQLARAVPERGSSRGPSSSAAIWLAPLRCRASWTGTGSRRLTAR